MSEHRPEIKVDREKSSGHDRLAELSLDEAARFRSAADTFPVMMWQAGPDKGTVWVNQRWLDFVGRTTEQELGRGWTESLHPDDAEPSFAAYAAAFDAREVSRIEYRLRRSDGEYRWILETGMPLYGPGGEFLGYVGTCLDITDRKLAEEALQESEARKAAILATALDAIISMDQEGYIAEFNPAAEKMFGRRRDDVLGQSMAELIVPAAMRERHHRGLAHFLATGHGPVLDRRIEVDALRADGTEFPVELAITARRVNDDWLFTAYLRDLTERRQAEQALRQAEERLRQSQKIEAVGRLAGGVAHDFNNFLTLIGASVGLLRARPGLDETSRRLIADVDRASRRAAQLTGQLLAFSRKQILQPTVLDLGALVAETAELLRRLIEEDVAVTTAAAPNLWPIRADRGQLEQVLVNLAVNARDAMPRGGRLAIAARNLETGPQAAHGRPEVEAGRYVVLTVSDTGCGMDAATRERLFEPFFTTKESGQGTGLGLATVYGIVKQSGGWIFVDSEPGAGTSFEIYLPAVPETPPEDSPSAEGENVAVGGEETILLVEDDSTLRPLLSSSLRDCGYTVHEAGGGEEALRRLEEHGEAIALVISDVIMPGMSGGDLAVKIRAEYPEMRILFLSGYTDDAVVRHGVLEGSMPFLQKPFSPAGLAKKVRQVLDS